MKSMPYKPPVHRPPGWTPKTPWKHAPGRSSATIRGYNSEWQVIRKSVLAVEPFCRSCAANGLGVPATHVDHIKPKSLGGTNDRSNLQPLCQRCHLSKSGREGKAASTREYE